MPDADTPVALLWHRAPSLARACARRLRDDGLSVAVYADARSDGADEAAEAMNAPDDVTMLSGVGAAGPSEVLDAVVDQLGRVDALVNLLHPASAPPSNGAPQRGDGAAVSSGEASALTRYPERLRQRIDTAAARIASCADSGAIVSQCPLPAAYAGTPWEDVMPAVRGAVTGLTRTACLNWADEAVRVTCLQTGLVDRPNAPADGPHGDVDPPTGRCIDPAEVAHFVSFLLREGTYITGQSVVLDGGLTSGLTGT